MTESGSGESGPQPKPLHGQIALVTGSTRGLGRTIAEHLALRGAGIIVSGRDQSAVDDSIAAIEALGGKAIGFPADLKTPVAVHRLACSAIEAVGKIDILVNNAGMSLRGSFWNVTDLEWDEQVNINVRAPFILAQHVARNMIEHGTRGRIVNISTIGATKCHTDGCVYDSAKGAVEVMTRNMAYELGPHGISVNCVVPGNIAERPGVERAGWWETAAKRIPFGRVGKAEDIAAAVLFFCLPESEFTTGQSLLIDGGHDTYLPEF
jgi:NAD(P)-dependent dehydrogenase (short-subunit alcohol dehydrogenase family)